MLLIGIALHGICYDFFFVSGQLYTNARAGEKFKSSAQGLITLATYGVGMLIGFKVAGWISEKYTTAAGVDYKMIWLIPAGIAAVVMLFFIVAFSDKQTPKNRSFNQFAFHIFNYLIEPQKKPNWKFYQSHQLIHGACNFIEFTS